MSLYAPNSEQFSKSIHNTALIGFDELFKRIKELESPKTNFPPYDIIKTSADEFVIKLAVSGYSRTDISVVLDSGKLSVDGSISSDDFTLDKLLDATFKNEKYPEYLHKGISQRNFKREFTLADTVEVSDVQLKEGMLYIYLKNVVPDSKKPKTFQIR